MRTLRNPTRTDVARCLLGLEKQFGKKPPDKNKIAAGKSGEVGQENKLQLQITIAPEMAQGGEK